eukprot:m.87504 g.87504  ORF g.87504 m.87504 type:complete len:1666 (+) comp8463_c0_seq3:647-5644(+)
MLVSHALSRVIFSVIIVTVPNLPGCSIHRVTGGSFAQGKLLNQPAVLVVKPLGALDLDFLPPKTSFCFSLDEDKFVALQQCHTGQKNIAHVVTNLLSPKCAQLQTIDNVFDSCDVSGIYAKFSADGNYISFEDDIAALAVMQVYAVAQHQFVNLPYEPTEELFAQDMNFGVHFDQDADCSLDLERSLLDPLGVQDRFVISLATDGGMLRLFDVQNGFSEVAHATSLGYNLRYIGCLVERFLCFTALLDATDSPSLVLCDTLDQFRITISPICGEEIAVLKHCPSASPVIVCSGEESLALYAVSTNGAFRLANLTPTQGVSTKLRRTIAFGKFNVCGVFDRHVVTYLLDHSMQTRFKRTLPRDLVHVVSSEDGHGYFSGLVAVSRSGGEAVLYDTLHLPPRRFSFATEFLSGFGTPDEDIESSDICCSSDRTILMCQREETDGRHTKVYLLRLSIPSADSVRSSVDVRLFPSSSAGASGSDDSTSAVTLLLDVKLPSEAETELTSTHLVACTGFATDQDNSNTINTWRLPGPGDGTTVLCELSVQFAHDFQLVGDPQERFTAIVSEDQNHPELCVIQLGNKASPSVAHFLGDSLRSSFGANIDSAYSLNVEFSRGSQPLMIVYSKQLRTVAVVAFQDDFSDPRVLRVVYFSASQTPLGAPCPPSPTRSPGARLETCLLPGTDFEAAFSPDGGLVVVSNGNIGPAFHFAAFVPSSEGNVASHAGPIFERSGSNSAIPMFPTKSHDICAIVGRDGRIAVFCFHRKGDLQLSMSYILTMPPKRSAALPECTFDEMGTMLAISCPQSNGRANLNLYQRRDLTDTLLGPGSSMALVTEIADVIKSEAELRFLDRNVLLVLDHNNSNLLVFRRCTSNSLQQAGDCNWLLFQRQTLACRMNLSTFPPDHAMHNQLMLYPEDLSGSITILDLTHIVLLEEPCLSFDEIRAIQKLPSAGPALLRRLLATFPNIPLRVSWVYEEPQSIDATTTAATAGSESTGHQAASVIEVYNPNPSFLADAAGLTVGDSVLTEVLQHGTLSLARPILASLSGPVSLLQFNGTLLTPLLRQRDCASQIFTFIADHIHEHASGDASGRQSAPDALQSGFQHKVHKQVFLLPLPETFYQFSEELGALAMRVPRQVAAFLRSVGLVAAESQVSEQLPDTLPPSLRHLPQVFHGFSRRSAPALWKDESGLFDSDSCDSSDSDEDEEDDQKHEWLPMRRLRLPDQHPEQAHGSRRRQRDGVSVQPNFGAVTLLHDDEDIDSANEDEDDDYEKLRDFSAVVFPFPGLSSASLKPHHPRALKYSFFHRIVSAANKTHEPSLMDNAIMDALVQHKWETYGRTFLALQFAFFFVMLVFASALTIISTDVAEHSSVQDLWQSALKGKMIIVISCSLFFNGLFLLLLELQQMYQIGADYMTEIWNYVDLALVGCLAWQFVSIVALSRHAALAAGFVAFFHYLKCLWFLQSNPTTGPLVRMIVQIALDMRFFLVVLLVILLGTSFLFFGLTNGEDYPESGKNNIIAVLLRQYELLFLGAVDRGEMDNVPLGGLAKSLFVVFTLVVLVIMLNLLIALMSDSFERIKAQEHTEFRLQRGNLLVDLESSFRLFVDADDNVQFPKWLHLLQLNRSVDEEAWRGVAGEIQRTQSDVLQRLDALSQRLTFVERQLVESKPRAS